MTKGRGELGDSASDRLPPAFAALYADAGPLRLAAFAAIRRREALEPAELAGLAGLGVDEVNGLLDRLGQAGLVRRNAHGRVVGIAGLSLEPTTHRLRLDGAALFTWCALDAIGIPAALGVDAEVVTHCWQCGAPIELALPGGQPPSGSPRRLWLPLSACTNVFDQFCTLANLFCNAAHLQQWRAEASDPTGRALDLVDSAAIGRDGWADFVTADPSR